jgi:hypothetical protein
MKTKKNIIFPLCVLVALSFGVFIGYISHTSTINKEDYKLYQTAACSYLNVATATDTLILAYDRLIKAYNPSYISAYESSEPNAMLVQKCRDAGFKID